MIKIKKDHTFIRNNVAILTNFIESAIFFAAQFTPIVNQAIPLPANVFFEPSVIQAVHFAVGIIRINKQSIDHLIYPFISGGISEFYVLHFFGK